MDHLHCLGFDFVLSCEGRKTVKILLFRNNIIHPPGKSNPNADI